MDVLLILLTLLLLVVVVAVSLLFAATVPLLDALNALFERIGLAGASRDSRTVGREHPATVVAPFVPAGDHAAGRVFVRGEHWNARCEPALAPRLHEGTTVRVVYEDHLWVRVVGIGPPA